MCVFVFCVFVHVWFCSVILRFHLCIRLYSNNKYTHRLQQCLQRHAHTHSLTRTNTHIHTRTRIRRWKGGVSNKVHYTAASDVGDMCGLLGVQLLLAASSLGRLLQYLRCVCVCVCACVCVCVCVCVHVYIYMYT